MKQIKFYKEKDKYGSFSNFSRHYIKLDGHVWPTTEHYFQAMKFKSIIFHDEIRNMKTPMEAALFGRDRTKPIRNDWEEIKDEVMKKALIAKFSQWQDLKDLLISTGNATLIEHTKNDSYWGDGGNGSGKNKLGRLLMEIREEIKKAA